MTEIDQGAAQRRPGTTIHVMYLLHAIAPFTFWTLSVVAIIIGAVTRDNVRGSWVESHYAWLKATFWKGIGWAIILTIVFFLSVVGILLLAPLWFVLTVWYLYRVIRGWLRLNDGLAAPE